MRVFQLNESVAELRDVFVQMVDAADYSNKTGLAVSASIVKAGGSGYVALAGSVSEVGSGTYRVSLASGDLDTEGDAMLKVSASGAADQFVPLRVMQIADEIHLTKAALVNSREHTIDTGVDVIMDDDGSTVLKTLTPSESEGVVTIATS